MTDPSTGRATGSAADGSYVVRHWPSGARAAVPYLLAAALAAALSATTGRGTGAGVVPFIIVGVLLALGARVAWQASQPLTVDASGVTLVQRRETGGRAAGYQARRTPWASLDEVVLDARSSAVELVLRSDAPLPDWMTARVVDPGDPQSRVRVRATVPGLEPRDCGAAIRQQDPDVVVRTG